MAEEKLLTIREVASILDVTEKDVMDLAEKGTLPAYKVGGVYLRFKKEQIYDFKRASYRPGDKQEKAEKYPAQNKFGDFLYFNDFYIISGLIIALILFVIFRGY